MAIKMTEIIYVACPAETATGGTELLHQFARKVIDSGAMAKIVYVGKSDNPVAARFVKYEVPFTTKISDVTQNDVLVVPEVLTGLFSKCTPRKSVIWWLSVDFYFVSKRHLKSRILRLLNGQTLYKIGSRKALHYAQSQYVIDFLTRHGESPVRYLSDYLGSDFFVEAPSLTIENKAKRVLYNPKKGIEFTQKLIAAGADIEFVAIQNMTPQQVFDLMRSSVMYIDFGEHPGKDRIPREAAISGCCIITGKNGSAAFQEDVPILERYKFERCDSNIEPILKEIRMCMAEYETRILDFASYRDVIRNEEKKFELDVRQFIQDMKS